MITHLSSLDFIEAASIALAVVACLGSIAVAMVQTRKAASIKAQFITFRQLMALRDSLLKARVLSQFPDNEKVHIINKLDSAFRDAEGILENQLLSEIFGGESARRIKRVLDERDMASPLVEDRT